MIRNLVVHTGTMAQNLEKLRGLIFSQQVLLALIAKGCARQHAYSLVQRASLQAWSAEESFKELLGADPDIQKYLDKKEIEEIFSLTYHLRHVEEIFARVFQ
jgi:adenylosuccinate lyase